MSEKVHQRACIALAGNPNCGKTTVFNALTGLRHKVANYPGVTVEKKEGRASFEGIGEISVVDLPGIYSLSAHSLDEVIATKALLGKIAGEPAPTLIVVVVDASNLERNLYLTSQLIDLGIPLIVALNMSDVAEERGISIKKEILGRLLDVPIVALAAHKKVGIEDLRRKIIDALITPRLSQMRFAWALNKTNTHDFEKDVTPEEASARYAWINTIVHKSCVFTNQQRKLLSDKLDAIIVHKLWGSLIFLMIMGAIFQSIFLWAALPMDLLDHGVSWLAAEFDSALPPGILKNLCISGIIPGVGSVLMFVPQIAILFFFLGLLEDSGYLARAAFLMDKVMRRVGLQGRSFVPLLSSFACAIPGILSTRTVPSFADRMTTILIAPLMACSARLPVYALLIAAFVPRSYVFGVISLQGLVLLSLYLLGVGAAAGVAWLLKLSLFRGQPALFVMEMPPFRLPALTTVLRDIVDRVLLFLKSAGTVILACSIVLWFLASFPQGAPEKSFAGRIGHSMEPVIAPLGFNWEIGVGILASFAAREVFVSSLATVYKIEGDAHDTSSSLIATLKKRRADGSFSLASALALMVFYVFACQCMSTLAVCRRETGSWRWPAFMFGYMTILAYSAAFITYRIAAAFPL